MILRPDSHSTNEPTWDQLDAIVQKHGLKGLSLMDTAALIWSLSETGSQRDAALEEAAKVCDQWGGPARAIRELKNAAPQAGSPEMQPPASANGSVQPVGVAPAPNSTEALRPPKLPLAGETPRIGACAVWERCRALEQATRIEELERELAEANNALVVEKSRSTDLALDLEKAQRSATGESIPVEPWVLDVLVCVAQGQRTNRALSAMALTALDNAEKLLAATDGTPK